MRVNFYDVYKAEEEAESELKYNSSIDASEVDPEAYDNATWILHLSEAVNGPKALKFILTQVQFHFELTSLLAALEHIINVVRKILAEKVFPNKTETIKQNIEKVFKLAFENFSQFKEYNQTVAEVFNKMLSLFPEQLAGEFKEKAASPIEALRYLMNGKKEFSNEYKLLKYNFEEIYTTGISHLDNFKQLLVLFPDQKKELLKEKQLCDDETWDKFAECIIHSVKNRARNAFPRVKLNQDNSMTFTLMRFKEANANPCPSCGNNFNTIGGCNNRCEELCNQFAKLLNREQLQIMIVDQCEKHVFSLIGGKTKLLEIKMDDVETTNLTEYQLNVSPEQLDALLKPRSGYAYRDEGSIMKLVKRFSMKEGFIRLAPVQVLDKDSCILRAAGCQMIEMPAVQLRNLLPNYDGEERFFHWVPAEVSSQLSLDNSAIDSLIHQSFQEYKMEVNSFYIQSLEGAVVLKLPQDATLPVRVADMDEDTKNFYLLYGNCDLQELKSCKSIEIETLTFFKYIRNYLLSTQTRYEAESKKESIHKEYYTEKLPPLIKSLSVIDAMIKTEENRIQKLNLSSIKAAPLQAPHSAMYAQPANSDCKSNASETLRP